MRFGFFFLVSSLCLAACEPFINSRGNVVAIKQVDSFTIGKTTMEDVIESCGTPSLHKNSFTWIYIGGRSEEVSFKDIEIKDRSIIKLVFDENKVLKSKEVTHPINGSYNFDDENVNLISNKEVRDIVAEKVHE